ncbi:MAG TPA: maleylpyruvate isomerase N-terminal domain-containing protein [Pseudonocardiaceae bacterium]
MVTSASRLDWQRIQDALRDEVARVTALLRSIRDPGAPAVGQWNLAEVALHLSQVWAGLLGLTRRDLSAVYELIPERAGIAGDSLVRDVADLGEMATQLVRSDSERDLSVLADRVEACAKQYFADCARQSPDELRPWLIQGVTMPLPVFTSHLLNETVVHGYDIARAAGRRWRINPAHAAMVLQRFLIPLLQAADPRAMVNPGTAAGVRTTYELHIRGGDRFHFIFDEGALRVDTLSSRRVDCHISADPVGFLLVVWNRQSQWRAIAKGQLMTWGRKPWLATRLRTLMVNP